MDKEKNMPLDGIERHRYEKGGGQNIRSRQNTSDTPLNETEELKKPQCFTLSLQARCSRWDLWSCSTHDLNLTAKDLCHTLISIIRHVLAAIIRLNLNLLTRHLDSAWINSSAEVDAHFITMSNLACH